MRVYILIIAILAFRVSCLEWYQEGDPHFLDTNTVFPAIKDMSSIKVIKFFSPWCRYCRFVKAYMDNYKKSHEIHANLKFFEFNCQQQGPNFCWQHFQVRAYPCVIMFNEKGESISRMDGLYPEDVVNNILDDLHNKAKSLAVPNELDTQNKQGQQKEGQQNEQVNQNKQENKQEGEVKEQVKNQVQNKQEEVKKQQKIQQQKKQEQTKQEEPKKQQKVQQKKTQEPSKPIQIKKQQHKAQPPQKVELKHDQAKIIKTTSQKAQPEPEKKAENVELTSEESVDKETKIDPGNIDSEGKFLETPKDTESYGFFKYLFYLVGISAGVLYAIKIFTSRQGQALQSGKNTKTKPNPEVPKRNTAKITTQDIENQILVQEVPDENL